MTLAAPDSLLQHVQVPESEYRFAFVMENHLGHATHYQNLRRFVDADARVDAAWFPLGFQASGKIESLPLFRSNWSARASWRTWRALRSARAAANYDALFFHTQVTTLLCTRMMRRVPAVISLDATPINLDTVGSGYDHRRSAALLEGVKYRANLQAMHAAHSFVTWSHWVKQSLIDDYGIDSSRISVISPGVNLEAWPRPEVRPTHGPLRILFVGGDFERKGGETLLQAFADLDGESELHIVTRSKVESAPRIHIYRDVTPNSELLRHLYATANLFVLPTLADTLGIAILEAMAAGLPVIATDVGAIREIVIPGETGLLVQPGHVQELRAALERLAGDGDRRHTMGLQGRSLVERDHDSAANAARVLEVLRTAATR